MSKKSIKDYFDVARLENHGPNYADDNPLQLKKLYLLKEERFKSFFDMIFYCKQACKLPLNYASYWKAKTLFCRTFLRPY